MKPGSVIVDLAAEHGRQLRVDGARRRLAVKHGVTIIGYTDLASRLADPVEPAVRAPTWSA